MIRTLNIIALFVIGSLLVFYGLRWIFDTPTSAVQSAWTTAGLIGAVVTGLNLQAALRDYRWVVKSQQDGDRLYLARDYIRIETIRLCQMLVVAGIGLYLLQSAPVLTMAQRKALHIPEWTTGSIIITAGLLGVVLGTVLQAILDRRTRLRFEVKNRMLDEDKVTP